MWTLILFLLLQVHAEDEGPPIPSAVLSATEALRQMNMGKVDGNLFRVNYQCSGFYTSDDGHYLTNKHCLDSCLEQSGNGRCILGLKNGTLVEAKTVFVPKCYQSFKVSANSAKELLEATAAKKADAVKADCTQGNDFALLKFDIPNHHCLEVSEAGNHGTAYMLGFPDYKAYSKEIATKNERVWITKGELCSGIFRTPAAAIVYPNVVREIHQIGDILTHQLMEFAHEEVLAIDQSESVWYGDEIKMISGLASVGHSGGSVVNRNGKAFGLLQSANYDLHDKYPMGAGYYIPLSHVQRVLRREIGEDATKKAFNCQKATASAPPPVSF